MKMEFVILTIVITLTTTEIANSQIIIPNQKLAFAENDNHIISQHVNKFTAFTINKKRLVNNLYSNGGKGQFQLKIDNELDWIFDLEFNDMRSHDFKQTYITDKGKFEYKEPFVVNTFKGKTSDNKIVRFTIDENTFFWSDN